MFKYISDRHLLVLLCALLVLTAGCTDAGSDGEPSIEEPDTAEAGVDAGSDADNGGGTAGGTESDASDTDDGDDTADAGGVNETGGDGTGSDSSNESGDATEGESADDPDDDDADEGSEGADASDGTEASTGTDESDTDTADGSDGTDEASEPPAFLGSDPAPAVLYEFPGHAGPSAGSPAVSDAESFEVELVDRGVDVRSVEDNDALTVEYATRAEDGWEPAIDEMGAVSAAFWGLTDSGHDASAVEATVTDAEGETLYTYRIERAWLTEYLERVEEIENGTATSPADPSEEYAETVWTTVEAEA